jgi:hypothetical protein
MALRFSFVLLFSVSAFGLGIAAPAFPPTHDKCGPNAEYLQCGSACAPDCANPGAPTMCTMQCIAGCFCMEGFLKNANGDCVRPQHCETVHHIPGMQKPTIPMPPPVCGDNEEFRECKGCDGTCKNPNPLCPRICVRGCACKPGHVRSETGQCIMTQQCSIPQPESLIKNHGPGPVIKCGMNEEFRQCKGCDGTCKNPNPICTRICVPGCACQQGYVRSEEKGECMMMRDCSSETMPQPKSFMMLPPIPKCGENELFHSCGTACPATCANPHPSPKCTRQCVIGCFCKEGFLKNAHGVCVAAANCEAEPIIGYYAPMTTEEKCASDREMYMTDCGNQLDCMATCGTPMPFLIHGYPQVPKKCSDMKCAPSCVCMQPYVRNTKGQCVERSECDHDDPFTTTMKTTTMH